METISIVAIAVSLVSLAVALARKHTHVTADLMAERDLALQQNEKLAEELAQTRDELHAAVVKITPDVLASYAKQAVAYAEQMGGTGEEKLRHAIGAVQRNDAGDNGKRDWSDSQIRIAIEAELRRADR